MLQYGLIEITKMAERKYTSKSEKSLDEYLISLGSISPNKPAIRLTELDMQHVMELMSGWLPEELRLLNIEGEPLTVYEESALEDGESSLRCSQHWGSKPTPHTLEHPIVEFAGPTIEDLSLKSFLNAGSDFVSNIDSEEGVIDVISDVRKMPFDNGSLGTIFISRLPGIKRKLGDINNVSLRDEAIIESNRALVSGGRLVWMMGTTDDFATMVKQGLVPEFLDVSFGILKSNTGTYYNPGLRFNGIFIK